MKTTESTSHAGYKIHLQKTSVNGRDYLRYAVDFGKDSHGKRNRRTFSKITKAKIAIKEHIRKSIIDDEKQEILKRRIGEKADKLKSDDLFDAATAKDVLSGLISLTDAARFWLDHNRPDGTRKTVSELVEEYIQSKIKGGRRKDTIRDLRGRLGSGVAYENGRGLRDPSGFALAFKDVDACHVTVADLESWLDKNVSSLGERYKMRVRLVGLFNYAVRKKYTRYNPAHDLEVAKVKKQSKPYALPISDAEKLMATAEKIAPQMVPYFAICLFAGVRPLETTRLDWSDIKLEKQCIYIGEDVSKTGHERYVDISDNLLAYLNKYKSDGIVFRSKRQFNEVRKVAGIRWQNDCLRHSFGSYHIAMYESSDKTALQMGHKTTGMLFEHYRRAVEKSEAEAFWAIVPESKSNVIKLKMAG